MHAVLLVHAMSQVDISNFSVLDNGLGGLALYESVAVFRGTNTFSNNVAINGAGMALYGNSYVILGSNSVLSFIHDKAEKYTEEESLHR